MFVKAIITQRLNGLRAQYTLSPLSISQDFKHSTENQPLVSSQQRQGRGGGMENGICVCGCGCVRAKNSLVSNELVNGKEEITAACKSLSICWFPFVLEIKLFSTWGGGGAAKMDIYIISYTQIYDNTSYTNTVKVMIKYSFFTKTL